LHKKIIQDNRNRPSYIPCRHFGPDSSTCFIHVHFNGNTSVLIVILWGTNTFTTYSVLLIIQGVLDGI
jgi:hypothetical protein